MARSKWATREGSVTASDGWVAVIRPGRILFEMEGVDETTAREALRLAQMKLSVASEFITRTPPEE